MIRITKALLQKFHRGECTAEERAAIAAWMKSAEASTQMADESKMTEIEERIWKNVGPKDLSADIRKPSVHKLFYYAAAASVVLVLGLGYLNVLQNRSQASGQVVYTLNSRQQKNIDLSGLDFTLASNSNAVVVTPLAGKQGGISFCGAVQITNNSGADIDYVFESACKKSAYTRKKVTFQSGKTYIAVHNFYKTDEVIVMKKENAIEFPDAISTEVMNEFSI